MLKIKIFLFVGIFIVISSEFLSAQNNTNDNYVTNFNNASAKHQGKFKRLMRTRGLIIGEQSATLNNIRNKISRYPKDTALLFYDHDGNTLRIWALHNDGRIAWEEIKISKRDLENKIFGFRRGIKSLGEQIDRAPQPRGLKIGSDTKKIRTVETQEISQLLLYGDISTIIEDAKTILVVPSLGIGTIPFGMLKLPQKSKQIIDIASIILLPSLFDVDDVRINKHGGFHVKNCEALILGNPEFIEDTDWYFPQLPGAENEANTISQYFDTMPLIGESATKENVLMRIESSDIIYFATHGVASFSSPLDESFIALSGTNLNNSRLTAREIQHLSLKAKLAVLSACQTGLGRVEYAGIIGLARAFKIAGVDEVVVSLWSVDDKVTVELMEIFMKVYIENNQPASSALRKAMIKIRKKYNDPRLWASFVVFNGKGTVIEQRN